MASVLVNIKNLMKAKEITTNAYSHPSPLAFSASPHERHWRFLPENTEIEWSQLGHFIARPIHITSC